MPAVLLQTYKDVSAGSARGRARLESSSEMFQESPLEQSPQISTVRWSEGWRRRKAKERVRHADGYRYSDLENSLSAAKTRSEATCRGPRHAGASLLA